MAPELILLGVLLVALVIYALLGGADFGAGVWDFNTALRGEPDERAMLYRAIGPVWEANHVWLIFLLVGLWTGFPTAFAALGRALWVPFLLALVGIVLRGSAYAFRAYSVEPGRQRRAWEGVFALASTATPFFLGAAAGAVASGRLAVDARGHFPGGVLLGWVSATSLFSGFFAVGVCAYLAAIYLTREAHLEGSAELTARWRRRSLGTGVIMGVLAGVGLVIVAFDAPLLWAGFGARAWPSVGLSVLGGLGSIAALRARRYTLAAGGAALAVAAVLLGWGLAQYPALVPPGVTVASARAPEGVLWTMLGCIAVGMVVLLPSLGWLLWVFKSARAVEAAAGEGH